MEERSIQALVFILICVTASIVLRTAVKENTNQTGANSITPMGVVYGDVIKINSTYHMYYCDYSKGEIRHAFSKDGINWTDDEKNNPVLTPSKSGWDCYKVGVPCHVWYDNSKCKLYLIYSGQNSTKVKQIGLAWSIDLVSFTKSPNNPILPALPNNKTWCQNNTEIDCVIKIGNMYYLWYNDWDFDKPKHRAVGFAYTTEEPENWSNATIIRYSKNPIYDPLRDEDVDENILCGSTIFYKEYYFQAWVCEKYKKLWEIRLYKCRNPEFLSEEREYLGIIYHGINGTWQERLDVLNFLTDDVHRNSFNSSKGQIWLYYSGQNGLGWHTGRMGRLILDLEDYV